MNHSERQAFLSIFDHEADADKVSAERRAYITRQVHAHADSEIARLERKARSTSDPAIRRQIESTIRSIKASKERPVSVDTMNRMLERLDHQIKVTKFQVSNAVFQEPARLEHNPPSQLPRPR